MPTYTSKTLNSLISTLKDGEMGFQAAAEDVPRSDVKRMLTEYSLQRAGFIRELEPYVVAQGEVPDESGSVAGALHRGWLAVKTAVVDRDEMAVMEECERGEDAAISAYEEALADDSLRGEARDIVSRQYGEIRVAHQHIRSLRDQYLSAAQQ